MSRKYLPALSSALSLLSFHRFGLGNRKPAGGAPYGVAARCAVVEKNAVAGVIALEELSSEAAERVLNASSVSGLALAIAVSSAGALVTFQLRGLMTAKCG